MSVVADTAFDLRQYSVEGPSGFLNVGPPSFRPRAPEHERWLAENISKRITKMTRAVTGKGHGAGRQGDRRLRAPALRVRQKKLFPGVGSLKMKCVLSSSPSLARSAKGLSANARHGDRDC